MNKIIFILSIALKMVDNHQAIILFQNTPQPGGNFFNKINEGVQNVSNKLFTNLKLKRNFTEMLKIKLLLTMHDNFRSNAENHFKILEDIESASKVDDDNETVNALFNLTVVFEEIFEETRSNNIINFNGHENRNIRRDVKNFTSVESNDTSADSLKFIKDILRKIDNSSLKNIMVPLLQAVYERNSSTMFSKYLFRRNSDNLKLWRPSNWSRITSNRTIDTRRIFKGKKAKVKKYPFVASFHVNNAFICAGAILGKDMVITAASCLQLAYNNEKNLKERQHAIFVRVRSDFTKKFGQLIPIDDIYFHPRYDPAYLANNLAIARTRDNLIFAQSLKIRRIEYDMVEGKLPESGGVVLVGWGDKDAHSVYNGPLTMARLEVYGLEACKEVYSENYVRDTNFCAGFVSVGSGACNRDVGAPGIIGSRLVGLVSFGSPVCGTPDAPTVFTKLGFYAEWITNIMGKKRSTTNQPHLKKTTSNNDNVPEITQNRAESLENKELASKIQSQKLHILRKLFEDLILKSKINVDQILHSNDEEDKNLWKNIKIDINRYPLSNKSQIQMLGIKNPTGVALNNERSTQPNGARLKSGEELEKIQSVLGPIAIDHLGKDTLTDIKDIVNNKQINFAEPLDSSLEFEDDFSGPIVTNDNNYADEDDYSNSGLSIEVPTNSPVSGSSEKTHEMEYEKRRVTNKRTKTSYNNHHLHHQIDEQGKVVKNNHRKHSTSVLSTQSIDLKAIDDVNPDNDGLIVKIISADDMNVRDRNVDNYELQEESDSQDEDDDDSEEPSRRSLLQYMNI